MAEKGLRGVGKGKFPGEGVLSRKEKVGTFIYLKRGPSLFPQHLGSKSISPKALEEADTIFKTTSVSFDFSLIIPNIGYFVSKVNKAMCCNVRICG